ncbi:phage tail tape measure protein [Desulfoluna spongiiphila]|uniref:phage tail tape measure protein n=1 Tax=Desulfoluna spongiiphila TaxID=419481 RepID=UPI0012577E08|nr:phage tail tape measure protein [Desulfoluna spongiiphila]VVS95356.1 phage tail tape measure protein [Desulfoluna spongiiphila]
MADLTRTVAVLFNAEDNLSADVTSMEKRLDAFGGAAGSIAAPLASAADMVLKVDAALTALAVGGLAYAYKKSMDFETASVNLSKILGKQKDQIGVVEESVLDLSNKYGQSATSVMNSTTDFKKAGFEVQEALTLTEAGIGLVIGAAEAELGVAESTEIIISVLKGFNAPASEAARLTDILNTVSNEYATTVTQLGVGMATLAPIANQMGFSFEETAGILTPIIEIFRSGDEASTALKMGLLKLIDDAKPVRDALASIGVAQKDSNGNLRSGRDILMDVAEAFKTLDEDEKLFLTTQLVGIRQAAKMVVVFDGLAKTTEITGRAMASAGSIALEVAAKLKTADQAVDQFKTGFENLGIVVGNQFRIAATGAINGGTEIELALQRIVKDGTFQPIFDALGDFADDLGDLLTSIAENLPEAFEDVDFNDLLKSFDSLGIELQNALGDIWGDLDLTTPEGLTQAIQKMVDGFTALTNVTAGIIQGMRPMFIAIGEGIEHFSEMDESGQKLMGTVLGFAKNVKFLVENLDLLKWGLIVLSGATMVNATATLTSVGAAALKAAGGVGSLSAAFYASPAAMVVAAGAIGVYTGNLLRDLFPVLDEAAYKLIEFSDKLFNWTGTQAPEMDIDTAKALAKIAETERAIAKLDKEIAESDRQLEILAKIEADPFSGEDFAEQIGPVSLQAQIDHEELTAELAESGVLVLATDVDPTGAIEAVEVVMEQVGEKADGSPIMMVVDADASKASEKLKDIDEAVPTEKQIEIQLQGDIDERLAIIKGEFELMQSEVEWQAKLDIAEAQASAKVMEAAFASINVGIESTGGLIASLFESMGDGASQLDQWDIERQIEKENELRKQSFDLQKKLTESQIEYNEAKTKALQDGDVSLTVQAEGLTPALEMIFHEILKMAQLEANAEGVEMLLGG